MSIGELKSIQNVGAPICTLHGSQCPVWPRVSLDDAAENLYDQLHALTGRDTFIVNNSRGFLWAQRPHHIRQRFVHLVRDGRAVVASQLRKFPSRSTWEAARQWRHRVRRNARFLRRQPDDCVKRLIYEDVKSDPEARLRQLCDFIGIDFDPAMLRFWEADHHFLGGNRGTLFSMTRATGGDLPQNPDPRPDSAVPNWDLEYYQDKDIKQFTDERWRRELSARQLRVFRWIAGRLNRQLGYDS